MPAIRREVDRDDAPDPNTAKLDGRPDVEALDRLVEVRVVRVLRVFANAEHERGDHERDERHQREQAELEVAERRDHVASWVRVKNLRTRRSVLAASSRGLPVASTQRASLSIKMQRSTIA